MHGGEVGLAVNVNHLMCHPTNIIKLYEHKRKRWKEITNGVTYYIAKDSLPNLHRREAWVQEAFVHFGQSV